MNGYELSRGFIDWSFENPEKVKPIHYAIFFFSVEHCNRLGWKEKFGFPSQMVMEAIGVKNWRTYSAGLNDLVEFGFINMVEKSSNQYSSNIIAIVNFTKAHTKALDKATSKHGAKHSQSTVSIDKQLNKETNKQLNNKGMGFATPVLLPLDFTDNRKAELFNSWISYRHEIKKPITIEATFNTLKAKFEKEPFDKILFTVNSSVENGWQGLFWDKYTPGQSNTETYNISL